MSNLLRTYVEGIHRELDFYPAWPPNAPHKLGGVGLLKDGQFQQLTTLANLGIEFEEKTGKPAADLSITSGKSVSVQMKAKGETLQGSSLPKTKAAAVMEFKAAGAFVFQAHAPVVQWIENKTRLSEQILEMFRTRNKDGGRLWHQDWCAITEIVVVQNLTVLISKSNEGRVEFSAEGLIPIGPAPLASTGVGLKLASQSGEVLTFVSDQPKAPLTPLFRIMRVRRTLLQRILGGEDVGEVVRAAPQGSGGLPRILLEEVSGDEMVPVLDPQGNPTRQWKLKPKSDKTAGEQSVEKRSKEKGKSRPR
ncbi:hypothetical protein [Bradyrhizobium diazoefficiens]